MTTVLGQMKRISDLRSVWAHEANDFTKWLAQEENLSRLGEAIGIDLVLEERESAVGSFSVDLYASEESTERKVIIENQLEDTNHDHLGKLITYASGKDAEVLVWVVRYARDEHRQAISWLNQHTDNNIGFFLVEIELWQIDNSRVAPKFNVVERSNDWAKQMKVEGELNDTQRLKLQFWQGFNEAMRNNDVFNTQFSIRKATHHHWYDLSIGSSMYHLGLTINTTNKRIGAEIYITDNKELFQKLKSHAVEIEAKLGTSVEWREASKATRILLLRAFDIKETSKWQNAYEWFLSKCLLLKEIAKKYDV